MTEGEYRPLPIWHAGGQLSGEHMARLRNTKIGLWLDYAVVPHVADEGSIEHRVLAWGSAPPFVCAYALVDPLGTDAELAQALAWVLHEGDYAPAMSVEDHLAALLGPGVREVSAETLAAEEKYARYEAGLD